MPPIETEYSKNHIKFENGYEYFIRKEDIYKSPISYPVQLDGFRCGRWVCPLHMRTNFNL